jgi:hypothetical protein
MRFPMPMPTVDELKVQAKAVRAACAEHGVALTHSKSLESIARQYGFRDWNAARAAAPADREAPSDPFSSGRMMDVLLGDQSRHWSDIGDTEARLRDLSASIAEISASRTWMTKEEGHAAIVRLTRDLESVREHPDWKGSEAYVRWLCDVDGFFGEVLSWADPSLAKAIHGLAVGSFGAALKVEMMPHVLVLHDLLNDPCTGPSRDRLASLPPKGYQG